MNPKSNRRWPGTYKIVFKDGTFGWYDWDMFVDKYSAHPKVIKHWLCNYPGAEYDKLRDGYKNFNKSIAKIIPVPVGISGRDWICNRELLLEEEAFAERYFEENCKNRKYGIGTIEAEEADPKLKMFNDWINTMPAQKMIKCWIYPNLGYSDVEVEDLEILLEHTFRAALSL